MSRSRGVPAHQDRPVVPPPPAQLVDEDRGDCAIEAPSAGAALLDDAEGAGAPQADGHVGPPHHEADRHQRGAGASGAAQVRHPPGVQARRHLRRRVRGADAVPVLDLRDRLRGAGRRRRGDRERRRGRRTARRSSSSAAGPTASARASSSTTAASTPSRRCAKTATRPSWSTATRRRCRPTTTPPTGCTSSRSRARTCWRSSTPRSPKASSCSSAARRRCGSRCR